MIVYPIIWEWTITFIYGDLGDGLFLFYPHYLIIVMNSDN